MAYLDETEVRSPPKLVGPERYHVCILYSHQLQLDAQELYSKIIYNKFAAVTTCISSDVDSMCLAVDRSLCTVIMITGNEHSMDEHVCQVYAAAKRKRKARASKYASLVVYTEAVLSPLVQGKLLKCCFKHYSDKETVNAICNYALDLYENGSKQMLAVGDVANGLALSFFYGYLNLLMTAIDGSGMKDRLRKHGLFEQRAAERNMPLRMFIIITESCYCPPKLSTWDSAITDGVAYSEFSATRGGCIKRDYKTTIHKLDKHGKTFHFVGELAAPILSLYDMAKNEVCKLSAVQKRCQMSQFYFILSNILAHNGSACTSFFELVYYNDEEDEATRPSLSDVLYERITAAIAKDLEEDQDDTLLKAPVAAISDTFIPTATKHAPVLVCEGFYSSEVIPKYQVKKTNRGIALIISNEKFKVFSPRHGADVDFRKLVGLMKKLNFEVIAHENLTTSEMRRVIRDIASRDHSMLDCFMCFVLSHGQFGAVCGVDDDTSQPLPVADILSSFCKDKCPSLRGKPKCFFLPHCQVPSTIDLTMAPTQLLSQMSREVQDDGRQRTVTDAVLSDAGPVGTEEMRQQESLSENTLLDEHFLVSYGTLPGNYAYRHAQEGSFYVQAFVETMESLGSQLSLSEILQSVANKVTTRIDTYNREEGLGASQHPYTISVLNKALYLPFPDVTLDQ